MINSSGEWMLVARAQMRVTVHDSSHSGKEVRDNADPTTRVGKLIKLVCHRILIHDAHKGRFRIEKRKGDGGGDDPRCKEWLKVSRCTRTVD